MKLKVQVMTVDGAVQTVTVEVARLDVQVAVKKAILALDLNMSDVRESRIITSKCPCGDSCRCDSGGGCSD